jgi:hypothetical protein
MGLVGRATYGPHAREAKRQARSLTVGRTSNRPGDSLPGWPGDDATDLPSWGCRGSEPVMVVT